jgi:hypothetical protein
MAWAQVTFKGNGILGGIQVIADARGNVKGKVGNPEADPPLRPDGKLDVGAAVGKGESACRMGSLFVKLSVLAAMRCPQHMLFQQFISSSSAELQRRIINEVTQVCWPW